MCYSEVQGAAVCCSVLQGANNMIRWLKDLTPAEFSCVLQSFAVCCSELQCVAVRWRVLHRVLQCDAVCRCSVSQS